MNLDILMKKYNVNLGTYMILTVIFVSIFQFKIIKSIVILLFAFFSHLINFTQQNGLNLLVIKLFQ